MNVDMVAVYPPAPNRCGRVELDAEHPSRQGFRRFSTDYRSFFFWLDRQGLVPSTPSRLPERRRPLGRKPDPRMSSGLFFALPLAPRHEPSRPSPRALDISPLSSVGGVNWFGASCGCVVDGRFTMASAVRNQHP